MHCTYTQFGVYEWCMTDRYDASIPYHRKIAHGIEVGDGIPEMRTIENARNALKTVGYEILYDEDLAERPDPIVSYSRRLCLNVPQIMVVSSPHNPSPKLLLTCSLTHLLPALVLPSGGRHQKGSDSVGHRHGRPHDLARQGVYPELCLVRREDWIGTKGDLRCR